MTMPRAKSTLPRLSSTRRTRMSIRKRRIVKALNRSKHLHREGGDHVSIPVEYFHAIRPSPRSTPNSSENAPYFWTAASRRLHVSARAHSERMVTFKCPYCRTEYGMTMAHLAFQQRSYAKCQVCHRTMYSWASRNVPLFTLMDASARHPRPSRNRRSQDHG